MTGQSEPWYQHPAIVVVSMFCCWPVGLVLLWQHSRAPQWLKIAVTAWIVLSVLFGIGAVISAVVDP